MSAKNKAMKPAGLNINVAATKIAKQNRESAGVNSPGGKVLQGMKKSEEKKVATPPKSPNSEQERRNQLKLNSPKANANEVEFTAQPNNSQSQKAQGLDSLVTQVERPDPKAKQKKPKTKKKKGGICCPCFSPNLEDDDEDVPQPKYRAAETGGGKTTQPETEADIRREEIGLLGRRKKEHRNKKCLVIDLDETLVHSSFKAVDKSDFIVPVEIDGVTHNVYVLVRPFAQEFLDVVSEHYEIVLFTASLAKYADPLLDLLDKNHTIDYRLFRDSCVQIGYSYVKDLSRLGRKMSEVMIIDNSPQSYRFQPQNAIPITSWFDDPKDTELRDLQAVMKTTLKNITDVRDILDADKSFRWLCNQASVEE